MDIDKEFVLAVLTGGEKAFSLCQERGLNPDHLFGDGKVQWEFVVKHRQEYGVLPAPDVVYNKTGIDLPITTAGDIRFWTDEIFNRRLFQTIRAGSADVVKKLDARDPQGAADVWKEVHRKLLYEQVNSAKVESLLALGKDVLAYYDNIKNGIRGIPTPWPTMTEQTLGWWPEDLVLFVGRLGTGKCVDSETEITDPVTGIPTTIERFFKGEQFKKVFTWGKERGVHSARVTAKVDTGRKRCLRFSLRTGRSVVVTPEHPFLTTDGWVKAEDLKLGQTLAVPARIPLPESPVPMADQEVDALALLLTEGSYTGRHIGFSTSDPHVLSIAEGIGRHFGVDVKYRSGYDYDFVRRVGGIPQNAVWEFIRNLGIDKKKSTEKEIPECVYQLGVEQLSRFLGLFWMCDGTIGHQEVQLGLASEKMVRQVQHLLLRVGVQSTFRYKKASCNGKSFDSWRITVVGSSLEAFHDSVPLWGEKLNRVEKILEKERVPNVGQPVVSGDFVERVKKIAAAKTGRWKGGGLKRVGEILGWKSKFGLSDLFGKKNTLRTRRFEAFCEVFNCVEDFRWIWDSDIFWDEILTIEDVGERKIYDLSVAPSECFVANDIIVHNTWVLLLTVHRAWQAGKKIVLISTEMNKVRMAMRFLSMHFRLSYDDFRHGRLGEFVETRMREGIASLLSDQGISIVGAGFDFSIEGVEGAIEESEADVAAVDGMYLIKNVGKDRHERVSNTFDDFKRINRRRKIVTITNLQFNRQAKKEDEDTLSAENIGITDVAGWNSDLIYGLNQTKELRENGRMGLKSIKIREGKPVDFLSRWDLHRMDFTEIGEDGIPVAKADLDKPVDPAPASSDREPGDDDDLPF